MTKSLLPLLVTLFFTSLSTFGSDSLSYTGRLVNADGSPVPGPVDLKVELAYVDDADITLFTVKCIKTISVPLTNGVFHVKIDYSTSECNNPSPQTLPEVLANVPSGRYPAIRVTDVTATNPAPREYSFQAIHAVPYASVSRTLFSMGATNGQVLMWNGSEWTPAGVTVGSSDITDGSIVDADISAGAGIAQSKIAGLTTDLASKQLADADLTALSGLAGTGVLVRTGDGAATTRQLLGTTNRVTVTNGDGLTGNPVIDIFSGLLPSPGAGDNGKYLVATGADSAAWQSFDSNSVTTALGYTPIDKASDTMLSGTFDFNGTSVVRVLDPILGTDAANKQYVDGQISGAANQWEQAGGNVYRTTGLVGIGAAPTADQLEVTGNVALTGKLRLKSDNTNYIELKAPVSLAATLTFNLPGSYGTSGYALITDGTGNLSWSSVATTSTSIGGDLSGTISNAQINSSAVGSLEISDGSIVDADVSATAAISQSKIAGLTTDLSSKEGTITAGTTAQYWRGDKTWQDLETDVRGTDLAGFTSIPGTVTAADTILSAIGKLSGNQGNYVLKAGDTMSGSLGMGGFKITGLGDPIVATDAATKGYVDTAVGGITSSQWTTNGTSIYYNSGNIGVGTSAPQKKFHVAGTADVIRAGPHYPTIDSSTDRDYVDLVAHGTDTRVSSFNERFHIENGGGPLILQGSSGNVGIGTTAPNSTLDVQGGDLNVSGQGRFKGWFTQGTGLAAEIGISSGQAYIYSYDRSLSAYQPMNISGSTVAIGQNGSTNFFINSSGNIGIGNTSPSSKVHISTGNAQFDTGYGPYWVANTDLGFVTFKSTGDGAGLSYLEIGTKDNGDEPIIFTQTGNERMRVHTNGNVGIGTTTPSTKLEVAGTVKATNFQGTLNGIKMAAGTFTFTDGACGDTVGAPCNINISSGAFSAAPVCTITMRNMDATSYTEKMVIKEITATNLAIWRGNYQDAGTTMVGMWTCMGN